MNEETTDKILIILDYHDDDKGERHYHTEGLHGELDDHIIGIIAEHDRKGIKINKAYLNMLERVR